jgi:cysteine-rich repeat protein
MEWLTVGMGNMNLKVEECDNGNQINTGCNTSCIENSNFLC